MSEMVGNALYAARRRTDGLPTEPWLRVHARGRDHGRRRTRLMQIAGSLVQWRDWPALPSDTDGDVVVSESLAPVRCDLAHDYATYVEPNVWVRHEFS